MLFRSGQRGQPVGPLVAVALLVACGLAPPALGQDEETRRVEITISGGSVSGEGVERSGGLGVVRVNQGQFVELHWRSEAAAEVHLHGYNLEADIAAGSSATMSFEATFPGRFAVELHGGSHDEQAVLYLEVQPN